MARHGRLFVGRLALDATGGLAGDVPGKRREILPSLAERALIPWIAQHQHALDQLPAIASAHIRALDVVEELDAVPDDLIVAKVAIDGPAVPHQEAT